MKKIFLLFFTLFTFGFSWNWYETTSQAFFSSINDPLSKLENSGGETTYTDTWQRGDTNYTCKSQNNITRYLIAYKYKGKDWYICPNYYTAETDKTCDFNILTFDGIYVCEGNNYVYKANPNNGFYDQDGSLYCDDTYKNVGGVCYKEMENGYLNENGNLECDEGFYDNGDYCVPNAPEPETNDCGTLQSNCESTCGGLSNVSSFGCSDGVITTPCSCTSNGSSGTGDTGSTDSGSTGDTGSTGGSGSSGGTGDTGSGSTGDTGSTSGTGSTDSGSGSTDTNSGSTGGSGSSGGTSGGTGTTGDSGSTGGTGTSGGTSGDTSSGDTGSDSGVDLSKLENLSASIKTNTENTSDTLTKILDGLTKDGDTSKTDSLTNEYNSSDSGFTSFYNDMKSSYNNFLVQFDTAKSIFEEGFNFNPIQTYANQNLTECLTIQVFGNHDVTLDFITPLNYLKPIFSIIFQIFMLVEVIRMCFKILKDTRSLF